MSQMDLELSHKCHCHDDQTFRSVHNGSHEHDTVESHAAQDPCSDHKSEARDIIDRRLAAGDLSQAEYWQIRRTIAC